VSFRHPINQRKKTRPWITKLLLTFPRILHSTLVPDCLGFAIGSAKDLRSVR